MKIVSFALTDVGKVRKTNEDYFLIKDADNPATKKYGKLYIVCDGMGGHQAGEVASKMAAEEFANAYYSQDIKETNIADRVKVSIEIANRKVYEAAKDNPSLQGMGTTIVGLAIKNNKAVVFNVGDSKCYLIKAGKIQQISEDHSLVNELVKAKIMTPEDAKVSSKKNILTRAIGPDTKVKPFIREINLTPGTKFLLCTDGLSNMVNEEEMKHIIEENKPEKALKKLIDIANKRGGPDNITAIEISIEKNSSKKMWLFTATITIIILFALLIFHNIYYSKLVLKTIPQSATISAGGKSFTGECTLWIKKGGKISVSVSKKGFGKEEINILNNNGLSYQINNGEENRTNGYLTIKLNKLVNFRLIDKTSNTVINLSDASLEIDGNTIKQFSDVSLSPGLHTIKAKAQLYYPVEATIEVNGDNISIRNSNLAQKSITFDQSTQTIQIYLEEIPNFTLNSDPSGAEVLILGEGNNREKIVQGLPCITPCTIDFNKIKGKRIVLIKEIPNSNYVYFKETEINDLSELPQNGVKLDAALKIEILSDVKGAKFYDKSGDELIEFGPDTFLLPANKIIDNGIYIEGSADVNNYSVKVSKTFRIRDVSKKIDFTFEILDVSNNSIELRKKEWFNGKINGDTEIMLNKTHNIFSINNVVIKTITGKDNENYEYSYTAKGGNP